MTRFLADRMGVRVFQMNIQTLVDERYGEQLSPANVLARLGVMVVVAICFGLAAQLLVGAS